MNEMFTKRQILQQQWFMTKFFFKKAPGFMIFHLFESVKLQVSIFMERTWAVNYILVVAETRGDFRKILWCMGILMAAIAVSTVTFAVYKQYAMPKAAPVFYKALRMEIYEKAKELDLACYDNKDFYEKFLFAVQEADKCTDRYIEMLGTISSTIVQMLCSSLFCFYINPAAFIIVIVTIPIELMLITRENKETVAARMERVAYEQKREYENRVFYLADYAKELRLHPAMKEKCRMDYKESNDKIRSINKKYGKKLFAYEVLREAFLFRMIKNGVAWTVLLYQMLVLHTLSGAHLVTSRSCIWRLSGGMKDLVEGFRIAAENSAYIYQIRELLQMEPSIASLENAAVPRISGEISIRNVSFSYLPGRPVLKGITLNVKPGQKIALVGYNGSGKSTLVKLLLRLYDVDAGEIRYHGKDIRDYEITDYRHSIGSVFQDYKIYAASLKENVLMDVETGSREETYQVEKALYDAHFTLENNRLTYQIETPLTTEFEKDGVNLSGGEAQKVAIARTLYRRQNIIIMDEPSSALDPLAEYRLNQELNEIAKDKTVIFISHRLSTTRDADCIYMMEAGEIIESGTHKELLLKNGKYAAMWNVQAGLYRESFTNP